MELTEWNTDVLLQPGNRRNAEQIRPREQSPGSVVLSTDNPKPQGISIRFYPQIGASLS